MYTYKIGDLVRLKDDADFDDVYFGEDYEGTIENIDHSEFYSYTIESSWSRESQNFSLYEIDCLVNPPEMVLKRI